MNSIIVDTNPLAYIYNAVPVFGEKYASLMGGLDRKNILIIPKIVYGELSLIFRDSKKLNAFISDTGIVIDDVKSETYIIAAKRWEKYSQQSRLQEARLEESLMLIRGPKW